jgi:hypothetical protein
MWSLKILDGLTDEGERARELLARRAELRDRLRDLLGPRPAVWCNWSRVVFAMAGCRYDYDAIRAGGATSSASAVGALSWAMELSDR